MQHLPHDTQHTTHTTQHTTQHLSGLDLYFAMARGAPGAPALDMSKFFDSNYHFMVSRSCGCFQAIACACFQVRAPCLVHAVRMLTLPTCSGKHQ